MAYKPKRPCKVSGCTEYAVPGQSVCEMHRLQYGRQHVYDRATHAIYCTRAWVSARKAYLMANPLCVLCQREGRLTPATDVDHIIPHRGDRRAFWDTSNWQALCHPCHSRKTAGEDGGFGNRQMFTESGSLGADTGGRGLKSLEPSVE